MTDREDRDEIGLFADDEIHAPSGVQTLSAINRRGHCSFLNHIMRPDHVVPSSSAPPPPKPARKTAELIEDYHQELDAFEKARTEFRRYSSRVSGVQAEASRAKEALRDAEDTFTTSIGTADEPAAHAALKVARDNHQASKDVAGAFTRGATPRPPDRQALKGKKDRVHIRLHDLELATLPESTVQTLSQAYACLALAGRAGSWSDWLARTFPAPVTRLEVLGSEVREKYEVRS